MQNYISVDLTGVNPDFKRTNELRELKTSIDYTVVLDYGSFFTESLVIRDQETNRLLQRGIDYRCLEINNKASKETGKEVCDVITFINKQLKNVVITYQFVGGEYLTGLHLFKELNDVYPNGVQVIHTWDGISNKPISFNVDDHDLFAKSIYGFDEVVKALNTIKDNNTTVLSTISSKVDAEVEGFVNLLNNAIDGADVEIQNTLKSIQHQEGEYIFTDNPEDPSISRGYGKWVRVKNTILKGRNGDNKFLMGDGTVIGFGDKQFVRKCYLWKLVEEEPNLPTLVAIQQNGLPLNTFHAKQPVTFRLTLLGVDVGSRVPFIVIDTETNDVCNDDVVDISRGYFVIGNDGNADVNLTFTKDLIDKRYVVRLLNNLDIKTEVTILRDNSEKTLSFKFTSDPQGLHEIEEVMEGKEFFLQVNYLNFTMGDLVFFNWSLGNVPLDRVIGLPHFTTVTTGMGETFPLRVKTNNIVDPISYLVLSTNVDGFFRYPETKTLKVLNVDENNSVEISFLDTNGNPIKEQPEGVNFKIKFKGIIGKTYNVRFKHTLAQTAISGIPTSITLGDNGELVSDITFPGDITQNAGLNQLHVEVVDVDNGVVMGSNVLFIKDVVLRLEPIIDFYKYGQTRVLDTSSILEGEGLVIKVRDTLNPGVFSHDVNIRVDYHAIDNSGLVTFKKSIYSDTGRTISASLNRVVSNKLTNDGFSLNLFSKKDLNGLRDAPYIVHGENLSFLDHSTQHRVTVTVSWREFTPQGVYETREISDFIDIVEYPQPNIEFGFSKSRTAFQPITSIHEAETFYLWVSNKSQLRVSEYQAQWEYEVISGGLDDLLAVERNKAPVTPTTTDTSSTFTQTLALQLTPYIKRQKAEINIYARVFAKINEPDMVGWYPLGRIPLSIADLSDISSIDIKAWDSKLGTDVADNLKKDISTPEFGVKGGNDLIVEVSNKKAYPNETIRLSFWLHNPHINARGKFEAGAAGKLDPYPSSVTNDIFAKEFAKTPTATTLTVHGQVFKRTHFTSFAQNPPVEGAQPTVRKWVYPHNFTSKRGFLVVERLIGNSVVTTGARSVRLDLLHKTFWEIRKITSDREGTKVLHPSTMHNGPVFIHMRAHIEDPHTRSEVINNQMLLAFGPNEFITVNGNNRVVVTNEQLLNTTDDFIVPATIKSLRAGGQFNIPIRTFDSRTNITSPSMDLLADSLREMYSGTTDMFRRAYGFEIGAKQISARVNLWNPANNTQLVGVVEGLNSEIEATISGVYGGEVIYLGLLPENGWQLSHFDTHPFGIEKIVSVSATEGYKYRLPMKMKVLDGVGNETITGNLKVGLFIKGNSTPVAVAEYNHVKSVAGTYQITVNDLNRTTFDGAGTKQKYTVRVKKLSGNNSGSLKVRLTISGADEWMWYRHPDNNVITTGNLTKEFAISNTSLVDVLQFPLYVGNDWRGGVSSNRFTVKVDVFTATRTLATKTITFNFSNPEIQYRPYNPTLDLIELDGSNNLVQTIQNNGTFNLGNYKGVIRLNSIPFKKAVYTENGVSEIDGVDNNTYEVIWVRNLTGGTQASVDPNNLVFGEGDNKLSTTGNTVVIGYITRITERVGDGERVINLANNERLLIGRFTSSYLKGEVVRMGLTENVSQYIKRNVNLVSDKFYLDRDLEITGIEYTLPTWYYPVVQTAYDGDDYLRHDWTADFSFFIYRRLDVDRSPIVIKHDQTVLHTYTSPQSVTTEVKAVFLINDKYRIVVYEKPSNNLWDGLRLTIVRIYAAKPSVNPIIGLLEVSTEVLGTTYKKSVNLARRFGEFDKVWMTEILESNPNLTSAFLYKTIVGSNSYRVNIEMDGVADRVLFRSTNSKYANIPVNLMTPIHKSDASYLEMMDNPTLVNKIDFMGRVRKTGIINIPVVTEPVVYFFDFNPEHKFTVMPPRHTVNNRNFIIVDVVRDSPWITTTPNPATFPDAKYVFDELLTGYTRNLLIIPKSNYDVIGISATSNSLGEDTTQTLPLGTSIVFNSELMQLEVGSDMGIWSRGGRNVIHDVGSNIGHLPQHRVDLLSDVKGYETSENYILLPPKAHSVYKNTYKNTGKISVILRNKSTGLTEIDESTTFTYTVEPDPKIPVNQRKNMLIGTVVVRKHSHVGGEFISRTFATLEQLLDIRVPIEKNGVATLHPIATYDEQTKTVTFGAAAAWNPIMEYKNSHSVRSDTHHRYNTYNEVSLHLNSLSLALYNFRVTKRDYNNGKDGWNYGHTTEAITKSSKMTWTDNLW